MKKSEYYKEEFDYLAEIHKYLTRPTKNQHATIKTDAPGWVVKAIKKVQDGTLTDAYTFNIIYMASYLLSESPYYPDLEQAVNNFVPLKPADSATQMDYMISDPIRECLTDEITRDIPGIHLLDAIEMVFKDECITVINLLWYGIEDFIQKK